MRSITANFLLVSLLIQVGMCSPAMAKESAYGLSQVKTEIEIVGASEHPTFVAFERPRVVKPYRADVRTIAEPIRGFRQNLLIATIPVYLGLVVLILAK